MSDNASKIFDCVEAMRKTRDELSTEIEGMSYDELVQWFRSRRYTDPILQRLAENAAQQADAAGRTSADR